MGTITNSRRLIPVTLFCNYADDIDVHDIKKI